MLISRCTEQIRCGRSEARLTLNINTERLDLWLSAPLTSYIGGSSEEFRTFVDAKGCKVKQTFTLQHKSSKLNTDKSSPGTLCGLLSVSRLLQNSVKAIIGGGRQRNERQKHFQRTRAASSQIYGKCGFNSDEHLHFHYLS